MKKYIFIALGCLAIGAHVLAEQRPFYIRHTLAGNFTTNVVASTTLSVTNTSVPGYADEALIQRVPVFASFSFGYSQANATVTVTRVSRGTTWAVTNRVLTGVQGEIDLGEWVYSTNDIINFTCAPCPTNNTTVEITHR